jgi:hypothetical protein
MEPATSSYFALSRSPRYSLTFALPLLAVYEGLAAVTGELNGGIRNGADVILKELFAAVAGPQGPLIFGVLLAGTMVILVIRDARRNRGGLRTRVFLLMLAESALLALALGSVVGAITARLLPAGHTLALGPLRDVGWATALTVSLGAGLYEELLFRVLLVGGIVVIARRLLGPVTSRVIAVVIGAVVFSTWHYIGPFGDTFAPGSFVFRTIAGLAFSGLFVTRGFGITAWTHALYDVFLVVARG